MVVGYPSYQQQPFTGQQSVHKDIIPIVPRTENNFNKLSGIDKGTSPEETKFHNKSNKAIEEIDFKGILGIVTGKQIGRAHV